MNDNTTTDRMGWMACQNQGSVVIPAFAPMQVIDGFTNMGDTILKVDMIGSSANPSFNARIAFNREFPIPAMSGSQGGYGTCTYTQPCWVAYDTGTPSPGDVWGIKAGQFSLTKGGTGQFRVWRVNATDKRILGAWEGVSGFVAQAPSGVPAQSGGTPGSATATVYYFNGTSYVATAWTNVTIYNQMSAPVAANVFLLVEYFNGLPIVVSEDCPS
jgi:hypothetical protein